MRTTIETSGPLTRAGTLRRRVYNLAIPRDMARFVARERYAWPGAYPLVLVTDDGGVLCAPCVRGNFRQIVTTHARSGWMPAHVDIAECFDDNSCDHCGRALNPDGE